ncbi:MAG: hypothetical protein ETSY1_42200 [Candidatus Entotheonella factor]|uniref:Uncharacterized protein n=1 Tax=Entotheonella factor TaxID=1429438 RepID=W4L404_ENTF1|nr:MAG: hypothetical protein ETSY1_42200 [Candidatus Entotheonella factor]
MGNQDEFHWDNDKSDLLEQTRGFSLYAVAEAIFSNVYVAYQHHLYPEQSRVIGSVEGMLITLVYEFVEDDFGSFIKLITY